MAADLAGGPYPGGQCSFASTSDLDQLPQSEIEATVAAYFTDARAATENVNIIASRRPTFVWANEARIACGQALGYLKSDVIDTQTVQKCDCFYNRYLSYR